MRGRAPHLNPFSTKQKIFSWSTLYARLKCLQWLINIYLQPKNVFHNLEECCFKTQNMTNSADNPLIYVNKGALYEICQCMPVNCLGTMSNNHVKKSGKLVDFLGTKTLNSEKNSKFQTIQELWPVNFALYKDPPQRTSSICTVPLHFALYQWTLYCASTLCTVPALSPLYQYTLHCTSTLCTHNSTSTLCSVPVHYAIRDDSFTFCLPLNITLYMLYELSVMLFWCNMMVGNNDLMLCE